MAAVVFMVDRGSEMVDGEEERVKRDWGFEIGGSATALTGMDSPQLRRRNPARG